MSLLYLEFDFKVEPLQPASDILMAELGEVGFESFVENEEGLVAYILKSDWKEGALEDLFVFQHPDFQISWTSKEIEQQNWNAEWDTRRLWLETLSEKGQAFEMTGAAVNADDVAEFLQRLTTSKHFQNIKLDYVEAKEKRVSQGRTARIVRYVTFRITGDLSYSGAKIMRVEDPKNSRRGKRN